jgi:putative toxin-antitoxin system antitoxin component (TIGR02293 family)
MASARTEDETRKVVALLGGQGVFPGRIKDTGDLQKALRRGFPYATFVAVLKALDLNSIDLALLVGVASRTLARRKTARFLSPIESDRLYRVARITQHASEVLGSLPKARTWLRQENRALGGDSPVSQLDTEIGERRVEDLLNRVNYGVYS